MLRAQTQRLIRVLPARGWAIAAAVLWLVFNLLCLDRFPTVFIDEAENGNHAYNLAIHGQAVFSLYDDLYPKHLEYLRQSWPPVIRPVFIRSLAAFIKVVGFSLFRGRLFSLILGFLCLLGVYWAGEFVGNSLYGLAAMLFLGTYFPFLYSSHSIRPEIFLAFDGLLIYLTLIFALDENAPGWYVAAGVLTGLAPGIHTNGLALMVPVSVALLGNKRWRGTFWTGVGWVIGITIFVRLADWERFIPGYYALFFREFTTPPMVSAHGNILRIMVDESGRYFGHWIFGQWEGGLLFNHLLSVQHVMIGAVVVRGCFQKSAERFTALFAAGLMVAYTFLVGQKASNYLTALAPFFALTVAMWFVGTWGRVPLSNAVPLDNQKAIGAGLTLSGWIVLGLAPLGTLLLVLSITSYSPSFMTIATRFSDHIPPNSRIAGPQPFWLGMPSDHYRDIGVLSWHRMLLNEKNLWRPLEGWKPDYVILENSMARMLAKRAHEPHQPIMRGPTGILPWPHQVVDVLETGPAYGDTMALVHIDWSAQASQ